MAAAKNKSRTAVKSASKSASKSRAVKAAGSKTAVAKRAGKSASIKAQAGSVKTSAKSSTAAVKAKLAAAAAAKRLAARKAAESAKKAAAAKAARVAAEKPAKSAGATTKKGAKNLKPQNLKLEAKKIDAKKTEPKLAPVSAVPAAAAKPVLKTVPSAVPPAKPLEIKAEAVMAKQSLPPAAAVKTAPPVLARPVAVVVVKTEPVKAAEARPLAAVIQPGKPVLAKIEIKAPLKSGAHRTGFKSNEFIVYPAHGVGQIVAIEEQEVAGFKLELFVISFAKDKMTLKVPLPKVLNGAIRKLADGDTVKRALDTLTGRARIKRTMWSRRAQEYEAKINSGDLGSIAEVVRDLYRSEAQPEQSYSERQLYEAALDRMAREIAVVHKVIEGEALKMIDASLQKGPRRGLKTDGPGETALAGEIGEAA